MIERNGQGACCCNRREWQSFFLLIYPNPTNGASFGNQKLVLCRWFVQLGAQHEQKVSSVRIRLLSLGQGQLSLGDLCMCSQISFAHFSIKKILLSLSEVRGITKKENKIGKEPILLITELIVVVCAFFFFFFPRLKFGLDIGKCGVKFYCI